MIADVDKIGYWFYDLTVELCCQQNSLQFVTEGCDCFVSLTNNSSFELNIDVVLLNDFERFRLN